MQVNWDKELDEEAERQRRRKKDSQKSTSHNPLPPVKKPEVVPQLPKPRSSVSPKPNRTSNNTATLDLLGLGKSTNSLFQLFSFLFFLSVFYWRINVSIFQQMLRKVNQVLMALHPGTTYSHHFYRLLLLLPPLWQTVPRLKVIVQTMRLASRKKKVFSINQLRPHKKRVKWLRIVY